MSIVYHLLSNRGGKTHPADWHKPAHQPAVKRVPLSSPPRKRRKTMTIYRVPGGKETFTAAQLDELNDVVLAANIAINGDAVLPFFLETFLEEVGDDR
jgi:hypothetical protein